MTRRFDRPGSAVDTAANPAARSAAVRLIAWVGEDDEDTRLAAMMDDAGVAVAVAVARVPEPSWPATTEVRWVSRHHQMLGADFESPPPHLRERAADRFARALPVRDLVEMSD